MGITHRLTCNNLVCDGLPLYSFAHHTIITTTFCSPHAVFPFNNIHRNSVRKKRFLRIKRTNSTLNLTHALRVTPLQTIWRVQAMTVTITCEHPVLLFQLSIARSCYSLTNGWFQVTEVCIMQLILITPRLCSFRCVRRWCKIRESYEKEEHYYEILQKFSRFVKEFILLVQPGKIKIHNH